ncbi:MAG: hypothetical protein IBJ16_13040, partial [Chitinophagaceae bacterium]|nr:hypothetical protein [Chitinophagaceae bacterium]
MKQTIIVLRTIVCTFICIVLMHNNTKAQDHNKWAVTKQKDYSKSYPIGNETLSLKNQFGKMEIKTWDKNEIKVDVKIVVSTQEEDFANSLLDAIQVKDEKTADEISFRTQIGDEKKGWSSNQSSKMNIDYTVYVPVKAKLNATNSFGPMELGDYSGEANITSSHGTLTAGNLSNLKSLKVNFGKAKIAKLGSAEINFSHTNIDIAEVTGDLKGTINFCNSIDLPLNSNVKNIDLKNSHTSLYLLLPKGNGISYDIATSNATATGKGDIVLEDEKPTSPGQRPSFRPNRHYYGQIGN